MSSRNPSFKLLGKKEIDYIIIELEKTNFSVLAPFFETNKLFPVFSLQDTIFINSNWNSNISTSIVSFTNNGCPIVSTNKYGISFFNSSKILVSPERISNISKQITINNNSYTDYSGELDLAYQCLLDMTPESYNQTITHLDVSLQQLIYYNLFYISSFLFKQLPLDKVKQINRILISDLSYQYFIPKITGTSFKEQKTALINAYIQSLYPRGTANINGILKVQIQKAYYPEISAY